MSFHSIHTWTLCGLVGAFFKLAFAYSLLLVSASLYIPSKFLKIFGLYFPCPCSGFLGYQNSYLCIDNLLVKLPKQMISSIRASVMRRFPFDLIFSEDQNHNWDGISIRERNYATGILPSEANPFSGSSFQNFIDKERGQHEEKRKRILNFRQRPGVRRRRRTAGHENGNFSPLLLNGSLNTTFSALSCFPFEVDKAKNSKRESGLVALGEDIIHEDSNEDIRIHSLEFNDLPKDVSGNEANRISALERALEEEKAARASLYSELEKERAASATAADEAMAMISRLQNDKALIEMESKQYQRLIEEKFAYDEEEMSILREVLIRREMDNHFLEKEIEAYREMVVSANAQSKGPDEFSTYESLFLDKQNYFNGRKGWPWKGKSMKDNVAAEGKWKKSEENNTLDMEVDVQDIHVVDFKTSSCKEDGGERSCSPVMAAIDELQDSDLIS